MKFVTTLFFSIFSTLVIAQQLPKTEIYLFDLTIRDGSLSISNPVNISNHSGYDNQPFFHPTKPILYYSSENDDGRTDIKAYDIGSGKTNHITQTNEREYSPTVTPDGKFISCIIQRDNGEQNLGKYPINGGDPIVLINDLVVGYHAWAGEGKLIAFILGEPNSLHYIDLESNLDTIVAQSISRSLQRIPKQDALSFLQKVESNLWEIRKINVPALEISTITQTRDGADHDIAWTTNGIILASDISRIHFFDTMNPKNGWRTVTLPDNFQKLITRMAVSPQGNKIALVIGE